jgi:GAF domain
MENGISLQEINDLCDFGNDILSLPNVDTIVRKAFNEIHNRLHPQMVSIFLFSKNGLLERYKISGKDTSGFEINSSWLADEKYKPGESFSGRAAYGQPYWSNLLNKENVNAFTYGKEYLKELGFLTCGISVPLNGIRKTFGTIDVINIVNTSTGKPDPNLTFSEADICCLRMIGSHVSTAISKIRKKDEEHIFAAISRMLADPELERPAVYSQEEHAIKESVFKKVANKLVDNLTPYKVCIVRLTFDNESLQVVEKSHSDGDEKGWKYRVDEPRVIGEKIVGRVFQSGKYDIIADIDNNQDEFSSIQWVRDQNLKSLVCFPLVILGKVIGTLSLFTGYSHDFSESDIDFLENVSFLLASFMVRSKGIPDIGIPKGKIKVEKQELSYQFLKDVNLDLVHESIGIKEVEFLIKEAISANVLSEELEELYKHLEDMKNERTEKESPAFIYQEVADDRRIGKDGGREIIISTAPLGNIGDFDGVELKNIKKPPFNPSDT